MGTADKLLDAVSATWRRLPIGVRRGVQHAINPHFLVGTVGLIEDGAGRVLLLEHRFRVPYAWGLPGGFLKRGEDLADGLRRELHEETGLSLEVDPEPIDTELNLALNLVSVTLRARITGGTIVLSREILSAQYCAAGELPEGTYPYHAAIIRRALPR